MSATKKILILGHTGMLGSAAKRYIEKETDYQALVISSRWPDKKFIKEVSESGAGYIVNAIGKIPQRGVEGDAYGGINEKLPLFLDSLGLPVIHPATDCEFAGDLSVGMFYQKDNKRDATDSYGGSKARVSKFLEEKGVNTKLIRTSIIGHELNSNASLLDWFLSQSEPVNGYTNHYWNGVTTLEWVKRAIHIIDNWDNTPTMTQLSSPACLSKYDLLILIREVYVHNIKINKYDTKKTVNKCLASDSTLVSLREQLLELKDFYNK